MVVLHSPSDAPQGLRLCATIGMFDGVHLGHAHLIRTLRQEAAKRGLKAAVVTFSAHPQAVLHPSGGIKMLLTLDERLSLLESLGVDYAIVLNFTLELSRHTSLEFMQMLRNGYGMQALVVGYNHRFGHDRGTTFDQYVQQGRGIGVEVLKAPEYLGQYAPVSSSIIRRLVQSGKVDDAMRCMGRPFRLQGQVVHGFHNGSGIGFPTANVGNIDPAIVMPHNGAYAVLVEVGGLVLQGMVNIGYRPTLHNGSQLSVEVNIFDFAGIIYGKPIALQFIKFLRLEFKMESLQQLRRQLTYDRECSKRILGDYIKQSQQHN